MTTIGERVKAAREKRGIHQAELARRLGCSVNALSMLEKNTITDPRSSRIIGIAEALKVSADYLLGLQETRDTPPADPAPVKPRGRRPPGMPRGDAGQSAPAPVKRPRARTTTRG